MQPSIFNGRQTRSKEAKRVGDVHALHPPMSMCPQIDSFHTDSNRIKCIRNNEERKQHTHQLDKCKQMNLPIIKSNEDVFFSDYYWIYWFIVRHKMYVCVLKTACVLVSFNASLETSSSYLQQYPLSSLKIDDSAHLHFHCVAVCSDKVFDVFTRQSLIILSFSLCTNSKRNTLFRLLEMAEKWQCKRVWHEVKKNSNVSSRSHCTGIGSNRCSYIAASENE